MINRIEIFLLKVFIIIIPLNYMIFNVLLKDISIIKTWKDCIILILLLIQLVKILKKREIYRPDIKDIFIIIFILLELIYLIISPNVKSAIYMFRVYTQPIIIYILVKNMKLDYKVIIALKNIILNEALVLSVYGVFQALFLGHNFLISIGYSIQQNGLLDNSFYLSGLGGFQRVSSTFASPNLYGFYISMILILFLSDKNFNNLNGKDRIKFVILISGCVLSFSRSSWLGLALTILFIFLKSNYKVKLIKFFCGISILGVIFMVIFSNITDIDIFSNIYHLVSKTFSLTDTSVIGHIDSFDKSVNISLNNIMGLGFGLNGPKSKLFVGNPNLTESSYFLLMYDFGVIGFFLYTTLLITNLFKSKSNSMSNIVSKNMTIFVLTAFVFLPYIQDSEVIIFYFIFIAILDNRYNFNNRLVEIK